MYHKYSDYTMPPPKTKPDTFQHSVITNQTILADRSTQPQTGGQTHMCRHQTQYPPAGEDQVQRRMKP